MKLRLSADIGGTFTDIVLLDTAGTIHVEKTASTPGDFKQGVLNGVEKIIGRVQREGLNISLKDIDYFVHGATIVLNALLERKLPATALVTTRGFRDVLEIMRTNNPRMYDLKWVKPAPLIERRFRFEVGERMSHQGKVVAPLDEAGTRVLARQLKDAGIGAVAVCLLHSYANPAHEKRVREIFAEEHKTCTVVLSSEIAPEIREFERTSTAVINAATVPIISSYLDDLGRQLEQRGLRRELYVMQSNGGIITAPTARAFPARTVMSGPSGGVVAAELIAKKIGLDNVVTIDMGGTSSDIGIVSKGTALTVDISRVDGWPIMAPMIEILAIGAGGGSIAWIDSGGGLRVGPQSAGAKPGPVCYRRGGTEPTVSDACVTLGRLNPGYFLGGEMDLDVEGARRAIADKVAEPLGISHESAAEGIIRVVTANMAKAIRSVLINRGHDPRQFTLMTFGGAGGMVAGDLLRTGEVGRVLVPYNPGNMCAMGMLATDFRHDFALSSLCHFANIDWNRLRKDFGELWERGLQKLADEGIERERARAEYVLDMRYVGQDHYLRVYVDPYNLDPKRIAEDFNQLHEATYGYSTPEFDLEMVNLRVFVVGTVERPSLPEFRRDRAGSVPAPKSGRTIHFEGLPVEASVYPIEDLFEGDRISGPSIIEDPRSTIVLLPGQVASVDLYRNIAIEEG